MARGLHAVIATVLATTNATAMPVANVTALAAIGRVHLAMALVVPMAVLATATATTNANVMPAVNVTALAAIGQVHLATALVVPVAVRATVIATILRASPAIATVLSVAMLPGLPCLALPVPLPFRTCPYFPHRDMSLGFLTESRKGLNAYVTNL